jgi:hypothetical protein
MGARSKYTPELVKIVLDAIADGVPITHVATLAGISFPCLCDYRRRYPDFDLKVREAFSAAVQSRLLIVKKAMESADLNLSLRAATWWLTHVPGAAESFSESRRVELTGADGSLIAAGVIVYLPTKDGEGGGPRVVAIDTRKELENGNGTDD